MVYNLINSILIFSALFFLLLHQFYILQVQYYERIRYLKYVIKHYKQKKSILIILFMIILISLSFFLISDWLLIISNIILFIFFKNKEKNKLKYTKRIIRMIVMTSIILTILMIPIWLNISLYKVSYLILLYLFIPLLTIILSLIMTPIEYYLKNNYVIKAKNKLKLYHPLIIGITGSYGKTSTKNYLYNLLSIKYRVLMTPKSYNTLMGITKTINDQLLEEHQIFIVEIGVDKKNGMNRTLKLLEVDHCIITSIGPQHLSTFKSIDNILNEKLKLAHAVKENGFIYLNNNNEYLKLCEEKFIGKVIRYSYQKGQEVFVSNLQYQDKQTIFTYNDELHHEILSTNVIGKHLLENIIPCIHLAFILEVDIKKIKYQLRQLSNEAHRMEISVKDNITIIDDAYNSNVTGFRAALDVIKEMKGTRILVTPGLIELGKSWQKINYQLGQYATQCVDKVILVGQSQTVPFKDGLYSSNFNPVNLLVVSSFQQAKEIYLKEKDKCVVLVENDLPDITIN